ncbi:MAG: DegQ family serine endoprotease [Neisseria sp.]
MYTRHKYLVLLLAASFALNGCDKVSGLFGSKKDELVQTIETKDQDGTVNMLLPDFSKLVEQEGSTVVNIQANQIDNQASSQTPDNNMDLSQFPDNDPFYEFFKRLVPNMPEAPSQEENNELNFGSGFIISQDGYILTNTHVVSGANNIKVTLNDKREYIAKLVGSDQQSDVALLKIDAADLPIIKVGSPKNLKPGEWVAAIGAPFGFDNSVTAGIVSAKGRSLPNENYTPFIQTDVAINPGNSGGPLFNLRGQVIGINSQIYSRSGGFMGISFAIPIDVAMNVADQLKTNGKVQRGQLGVIIQEVSYDLAKSFGLDKPTGALIAKVLPDSPAARAGLKVGDIVRSVNDETIRSSSDLPVLVGSIAPGKEVVLGVWRNGKESQQKVLLGSSSDSAQATNPQAAPDASGSNAQQQAFTIQEIGLTLSVEVAGSNQTLVARRVEGIAARAGLHRGDVILAVGQANVNNEASFREALKTSGKNVPLLVQRDGSTLFLALNLP